MVMRKSIRIRIEILKQFQTIPKPTKACSFVWVVVVSFWLVGVVLFGLVGVVLLGLGLIGVVSFGSAGVVLS